MRHAPVLALFRAALACSLLAACGEEEAKPKCPATCVDKPCVEVNSATWQSGTATCDVTTCTVSTAACVPVGGGGGCDRTGFEVADVFAYTDANVPYQSIDAYDVDGNIVWLENWYADTVLGLAPGTNGSRDLSGDNADYDLCGTCVLAAYDDGNTYEEFMAVSGSATVGAPAAAGNNFSVTLTNVRLEGDADTVWCLPSVTFDADAAAFPCDYFSETPLAGDDYCINDAVFECTNVGGDLVVVYQNACPGGCDDSTPGGAVCL